MRNLFNYIINIFFVFILLFIISILFIRERYIFAIIIFLCLVIYLLFSDVFFPSLVNINRFVFTKINLRKKILLKLLYIVLYLIIFFAAGYITAYILILLNLIIALDIIFLLIKNKRFFFHLFDVE